MFSLDAITLLTNGLTLAMALGFLLIVRWQDVRKPINQYLIAFFILVTLWNVGSVLVQAAVLLEAGEVLAEYAFSVLEIGFTGSSIAIYGLTTVLVGIQPRRFSRLLFVSLAIIIGYRVFLIANGNTFSNYESLTTQPQAVSFVLYAVFDSLTLFLVWRYRRRIRSRNLIIGIVVFATGQSLGFLNPRLDVVSVATSVSDFGTLLISFSILQVELITPLTKRVSQIESTHEVSLAITSQIATDAVLSVIANQAATWLDADAAGIFLLKDDYLELATVYNLPQQLLKTRVDEGVGIAGTVAKKQESILLENYGRDWPNESDMPLARETFGSTICVPLVYASDVIGVLMVVAGTRGRAFDQDDVRQLELVGAQAAVAISHGLLFSEQRELTHAVDSARSQLETVLVSTQNPVIAVDRRFRLIFANPAAHNLFGLTDASDGRYIADMLPPVAFPPDFRVALRDLYRNNAHIYEISLDDRVYLCHLARLGWPRVVGWVAVLNDVTQLKELDRLKSEMVRMTSHDLKNPLQAAMAHVDLLRDDLQDVSNSEVHLSLAAIEKQLERMNRIIRGILDLERADSGSFSFDLCQPEVVIANTLDELQHLAEDRQIVLKHETGVDMPEFWGDGEQFERALINLVENAIKFTPVGGTVSLNVDIDDRNLVFEIRDNGIGIPADLQAQIFDRFFRGRQKGVEHVSGSGLGLNLVKTVIENHNGEIRLESEEGAGTTFYVSVPIANEAEAT